MNEMKFSTVFFTICLGLLVIVPGLVFSQEGTTSLLAARKARIAAVLKDSFPVLRLSFPDTSAQAICQELLIHEPRLRDFYFTKEGPTLNEIFSISKMQPGDAYGNHQTCATCYRAELYNYALNATMRAIIDPVSRQVVDVTYFQAMQPDIYPELAALAVEIAAQDTSVISHLGYTPDSKKAKMSSTKTALNRTKCQRSLHLCVAPTFVQGDKALWAIVDLTDLKVAGVKWTNVGVTGMAVTERSAQNDHVMQCFCEVENKINRDGWQFSYMLTRSDGLKISAVQYQDKLVFNDVKMVDWHVSYSKTDGFGYSDAIGCPEYSQAAVVAVEPPIVIDIIENGDTIGFSLRQKYFSEGWPMPCSYNYEQRYDFYRDGSFRPVIGSIGRGCGNDGAYRPVTRISIAGDSNTFYAFKNSNWQPWRQEQWMLETEVTEYFQQDFIAKIEGDQHLMIEANRGQFNDGGKGDLAYFYLTKRHLDKNEGEGDLPTIGPCCNTDYRQGPEKFIEPAPETVEKSELVLWYVPYLKNEDTPGKEYCWAESVLENGVYVAKVYPCFSGPKLIPIRK